MTYTPAQDEMVQRIKIMGPGNHLCYLYETEKEHRILLTSFIRQGLEQGERVLYIVDSHTIEEVLNYLSDDGLPVQSYLKGEQLGMLNAYEAYIKEEVFHPDGMISFLIDQVNRALDEGYSIRFLPQRRYWEGGAMVLFKSPLI